MYRAFGFNDIEYFVYVLKNLFMYCEIIEK